MYNLGCSGLVDHERTNVIVVVTKSISSWHEFDDFTSSIVERKAQTRWQIEAYKRELIIADLQLELFPRIAPWPIVFVENGSEIDVDTPYPLLPNGELSHQNLFDAIRRVIEHPHGTSDLAGMHVLDALSGPKRAPLHLPSNPETEILVNKEAVLSNVGIQIAEEDAAIERVCVLYFLSVVSHRRFIASIPRILLRRRHRIVLQMRQE
ncbi:hypothetical protein BDP27DRAFT_506322 [Rhodocollybia butyracea]|uniref:Uncharacterized protein n=1 Tax=Rhodocollybia butyracea TaxID=206335 RepID=A0A9P5P9R6_9AGAR|nr:hypothetical protein BDP27DRAFT_506322 [Rhodocollybia butyracea]